MHPETGEKCRDNDIRYKRIIGIYISGLFRSSLGGKNQPSLTIWTDRLFARPRFMPPGEKNEEQLVDNISVANVEIMLERRNREKAEELYI